MMAFHAAALSTWLLKSLVDSQQHLNPVIGYLVSFFQIFLSNCVLLMLYHCLSAHIRLRIADTVRICNYIID